MVQKPNDSRGLHGQVAGTTALCTVGASGSGLTYCGYDITDLAAQASFEEVAFLLQHGELPSQTELTIFKQSLAEQRTLSPLLCQVLERIPKDANPMDVMRTGCSVMGVLAPEHSFADQEQHAIRMLAQFPAICCYWYHFSHFGTRIATHSQADSLGGHFLTLLNQREASATEVAAMHASLILYAEHEFNASTFAARVAASTLTDIYSAVTGAIGTLRGPLHGGANEAAMALIDSFASPDEAEIGLLAMLAAKEKIMGFGHAVYRTNDPRNAIIKAWSRKIGVAKNDMNLFDISERCETVMWREKKLFANADFYHASAYHLLGIPTELFTPIFVMSRVSGWTAHIKEQRSNNRIIRPSAQYIGAEPRTYTSLSMRNR
ncbi:2-methylcitrate synthase [Reinekea sp.]|jgi:2-methylcitrate synthase|uniref:bifunctional 2-methylcitrate synthase/citrate synthase n=1 Tax=Reinekea sp. TaxID=1970455 RepID=UPI002A828E2A|nr:2-methylcitrate synthase [Reinekea sp.]